MSIKISNTKEMKSESQTIVSSTVNYFLNQNVPIIQIKKNTKIPCWKKWEETTVEYSKKHINLGIESNYGILTGPIDENTTIISLDFDAFNNKTKVYDESISKKKNEIVGLSFDGFFETGTCGNSCLLIHSTNSLLNELVKDHNKIVIDGSLGGEIEILCGKGCYMTIPPSKSTCKQHDKVCKTRKFVTDTHFRFLTNDDDEDSIYEVAKVYDLIKTALDEKTKGNNRKRKIKNGKTTTISEHSPIKIVEELLAIIGAKPAEGRKDWMAIGIAVKTELKESGWALFDAWSKLSPANYDETENRKQWDSWYTKVVTMGTLRFYAKKSDEKKYDSWKDGHMTQYAEIFGKWDLMGEYQFAKLLIDEMGEEKSKFIFSVEDDSFYTYDQYNIMHQSTKMPLELSDVMTNTLTKLIQKIYDELLYFIDTRDKKYGWIKKLYRDLSRKFGSPQFKNNLLTELKIFIQVKDMSSKIDLNQTIFPFSNKCFDFKMNEYREIKRDEYVTKYVDYAAPKENLEIQTEIHDVLKSMFQFDINNPTAEESELYSFVLDVLSKCMYTNEFEKLFVLTGSGGNGKGVLSQIFVNALSNLCFTADTKFLTGTLRSGQVDSSLFSCKGMKVVMTSEPENGGDSQNTKFNLAKTKSISGNDPQTCRTFFKAMITYKPLFTTFLQCNEIPDISTMDEALFRRLLIIMFKYSFKSNANKNNPLEKQVDTSIKTKFNEQKYYEQFTLILIEHIRHQFGSKMVVPKCVSEHTQKYLDSNNVVKKFIDDNYEVGSDHEYIEFKELYLHFKDESEEYLSQRDFKTNMAHNKYTISKKNVDFGGIRRKKNVYIGLRLIKSQTEESSLPPDFLDDK